MTAVIDYLEEWIENYEVGKTTPLPPPAGDMASGDT